MKELFTMGATKDVVNESKGVLRGGEGPSIGHTGTGQVDKDIGHTLGAMKDSMSNPTGVPALDMALGFAIAASPLGSFVGLAKTTLGVTAAAFESIDHGILGDVFGTRAMEEDRDLAESRGASRSETQRGYDVSQAMDPHSNMTSRERSATLGDHSANDGGSDGGEGDAGSSSDGGGDSGRGGQGATGPGNDSDNGGGYA